MKDEATQQPIIQAPYHDKLQQACTESKAAVIWGHVDLGKLLCVNTEIPTTNGLKKIRDVQVGDSVFALDGTPTEVISKSAEEIPEKCYKVAFSDGTSLLAGAEHQWLVWSGDRYTKGKPPKTMTTQEMLDAGLYVGKSPRKYPLTKYRVPVTQAVQYPEKQLPVSPYALGAWLGDGTTDQPEITCGDKEVTDRVMQEWPGGWNVREVTKDSGAVIQVIRRRESLPVLRELGVLGHKHIPEMYKTASVAQRLDLLRGMMDTDGHAVVAGDFNTVELMFVHQQLAEDALEVIRSLGEKATLRTGPVPGYGYLKYRIHWTASDLNPFWLPRKAAVIERREKSKRLRAKAITSITPIEPIPMVCIGVAHPSHTYIAGRGYTVTHNCVTEKTAFYKEDGTVTNAAELRRELEAGKTPKVLTVNYETQKREWVPVKSVEYDGHVPCVMVTSKRGERSMVSHNHPFRIRRNGVDGWAAAKALLPGDTLFTTEEVPIAEEFETFASGTEAFELGVLFGMFCRNTPLTKLLEDSSEPCIMVAASAKTNTNAPDYIRIVRQAAERHGWRLIWDDRFDELSLHRRTLCIAEGFGDWAEKLGFYFERYHSTRYWLQTYHTTNPGFFPPEVYRMDQASIRSFLSGLFLHRWKFEEPDKERQIGVVRPDLAEGVMLLARRAGIRITRQWAGHRVKIRASSGKYVEDNVYTRLHGAREDLLPLVEEAAARIKNPYLELVERTDKFGVGQLGPEVIGMPEGRRKKLRVSSACLEYAEDAVVSAVPAGIHATFAVTIDSEQHTHLTDNLLTHNTQQISIGRVLWEIGRNPNIRICILQATEGLAEAVVSSIKRYIESSVEYQKVFPHVRKGDVWQSTQISVERPFGLKDPTVIAAGVGGNVLGRRFDLIIGDDICTDGNTKTEHMREETFRWTITTPLSRVTPHTRIWLIGNAWHRSDLLHKLAELAGWNSYKFPVRDPVTKKSFWPARWPDSRILEYANRNPSWEVARALDCIPLSDEAGRFRYEWFQRALESGHGLFGRDAMCYGLADVPKGCQVFTGVDLGISEKTGTDKTALVTLMVGQDHRITLLNIETGNWDSHEMVERIIRMQQRFRSHVYVESVFAQRWILQQLRRRAPHLPIFPFQTRGNGTFRNKRHSIFGVEGLAAELSAGLWIIPRSESGVVDPEVQDWITGCLSYSPEEHVADPVMASWIALAGCRKQTGNSGWVGSVEHGMNAILEDAEQLTPEEKREMAQQERLLERQKAAEGWWDDLSGALDLPKRSDEELAKDLGVYEPYNS